MKKVRHYVDDIFNGVPESEQKETVKQEIIENLEEKVIDLMDQGKAEEDAINKAIVEFGSIEEIKNELGGRRKTGKKHKSLSSVKQDLNFSIWGSALFIALILFTNFYFSPDTIWFVYPTFAILWWPLTMFYSWSKLQGRDGRI